MRPYPLTVVASYPALASPLPAKRSTLLAIDTTSHAIAYSHLVRELPKMGYERVPSVFGEGEWSVRGDTVDVFPAGADYAVRFGFFGDELESIEKFDIEERRTVGKLAQIEILSIDDESEGSSWQTLISILPEGSEIIAYNSEAYNLSILGWRADRFKTIFRKLDSKGKSRRVLPRAVADNATGRLENFEDVEPGEYVVHVDYGIGRYIGSSEILVGGERTEVYTIEYADGAKLHIPVSKSHLLSRYIGVKGAKVELHKLGGKRWDREKEDAKKAVADLAVSLLKTQAKRKSSPGYSCEVANHDIEEFEKAFPYVETEDQIAAIKAVKDDLAAPRPMDRLICGDAGYGKTEVAMRAAFIAAMNGRQSALLAPTTVLAEQHFETFSARFAGTPIRIEVVSRFQSTKSRDETFERLRTGVCDIVIGTHAILSPKLVFKNLGLVIIDEEQRFGVRHKEHLKRLRTTADVLALSATPIPRTLYLSLTGLRDLSLLRTPPRERVAVMTKIAPDSDDLISGAIRSEMARKGQVFFLHNRVNTISRIKKRLENLVPEARIVVAHGQMDSASLARKMRSFERGEYDILLSTTIIGSGIDIPRANTIIIHDAQTFGLADLYQLRGRVGRSSNQGFAYFLLPPSGIVDSEARERFDALKRYGSLGAGFNLAMRDLEIRGSGNLLGSQQSGHIAAIGFTLYCQLLRRAISNLKKSDHSQ